MTKPHTTIATRQSGIREDWLALTQEEILEPDLPIVDPHHHLWDFPTHRYLLPELLADTGSGHKIESTVFIECTACYRADGPAELRTLGETEFANGIAAMSASGAYGPTRAAAGIVGLVDLTIGARAEEVLRAHMAAAGPRFKGIRHCAGWEDKAEQIHNSHTNPPPHLYRDHAKFREGFATLRGLGLSFDAWLYHPQLGDLIDLARAFPEQPIVLDHVGRTAGARLVRGQARRDFRRLEAGHPGAGRVPQCHRQARRPRHARQRLPVPPPREAAVVAGVGGCVAALHGGLHRGLRRQPLHVREQLPRRQDFGVLCDLLERVQAAGGGCLGDEKAALFRETARRFYRL